jgi:hypothetical protein
MMVEPRALDPGAAADEEYDAGPYDTVMPGPYDTVMPGYVDAVDSGDDWIADEALDERTRHIMTELVMPRIGLDGRRYWPLDELPRGVLHG